MNLYFYIIDTVKLLQDIATKLGVACLVKFGRLSLIEDELAWKIK